MLSRLFSTSTALLAAVVLIGLGNGAVAGWFRAIGGGAAVGFAIAVFIETKSGETSTVREISHRFGWGSVVLIGVFAVAGGTINFAVRRHEADKVRTKRARDDVSRYVTEQGFWAGRPVILDTAVKEFGKALLNGRPPKMHAGGRVLDINAAAIKGPASGDHPLTIKGLVCSRYYLAPSRLNRSFGFRFVYRLVSRDGRNEAYVVSAGADDVTRGRSVQVTGLVAAAGPRRDNSARSTVFLMGLSPTLPIKPRSRTAKARKTVKDVCNRVVT
jgi:hypothetical protein